MNVVNLLPCFEVFLFNWRIILELCEKSESDYMKVLRFRNLKNYSKRSL